MTIEHADNLELQKELAFLRQRVSDLEHELSHAQVVSDALMTLFDGLEDGLLLLDNNFSVLTINRMLARLMNETPDALRGRNWGDICEAYGYPVLYEVMQESYQHRRAHQSREQFVDSSGQIRMLDVQTVPLYEEDQPLQMIMHVVDVTERLHLEAMLIQSERRAATGKLSATIAHEVNTPLQAIKSVLYLAERADLRQQVRHLRRASEQIDRISSILQRLLDLHHVRDTPPTLINVNTMLEQLLDLLYVTMEEQHIQVHRDLQDNLPRLWGNPDDLYQALLNLVLNALEAMSGGGMLHIRTRLADNRQNSISDHTHHNQHDGTRTTDQRPALSITITDTGHGIQPDVRARIFDPFFTTKPGGAGIGLAVSRKIITDHGGHIRVQSRPGNGSTFTLLLPLPNNTYTSSPVDHAYIVQ